MDLWDSDIFSADFFGSNDNDMGLIKDGAWMGVKVPLLTGDLVKSSGIDLIEGGKFTSMSLGSCWGQEPDVCETLGEYPIAEPDHVANAFGFLRSPWNMNAKPALIRSKKMCGMANSFQFPDCTAIIDNQQTYDSFADYIINLQLSPHGTVHIFTGGAFGECTDTYSDLETTLNNATLHKKIIEKLSDLEKDMWQDKYQKCPDRSSCVDEAQTSCSCWCPHFNDTLTSKDEWGVRESGLWQELVWITSMTDVEQESFDKDQMLALMDAVCNTDVLFGDMATSNSPLDILFFPTHNEVERIFQRKMLSSTMTDRKWPTDSNDCPGQKPNWVNLWFDYTFDNENTVSNHLTNEEFLNMLDPTSIEHVSNMNYVYNNFNWTHCVSYGTPGGSDSRFYSTLLSNDDWAWNV